ncbi:MAG: trimeric intracellular cation channel family protein [Sulfurospirillum sp.]|nr:MAG: trimeric intracellular cation channel family protein [Sulfurospirillum sp.]
MDLLEIAEIIGILSFALSGFFVAGSAGLDLLGIFIASFLTALGGGVIRDIIAGKPLYAFTNNIASVLVIGVVVAGVLFRLHRFGRIEKNRYFLFADTLGLVSFAISGALVGLEAEFNFSGVVLLSLITAVGGGVLRDMLINEVPFILTSEFYGTVAIIVGMVIYLLNGVGFLTIWGVTAVFVLGILLRLTAVRRNWHLPKLR